MSSAIEDITPSFDRLSFNTSPHQAWLAGQQQRGTGNSRNLQCMPSDDEDEDEDTFSSEEEDYEEGKEKRQGNNIIQKPKTIITRPRSTIPLPSDEEDNTDQEDEEEDDEEDNDVLLPIQQAARRQQGNLPYRNNQSAPSLPQQFEYQQQTMLMHQQQQQHFDIQQQQQQQQQASRSVSTDDLLRLTKGDDDDNEVIGQHLRHKSSNIDAAPSIHHMHQYQQQQQQQLAQFQYLQHQYVSGTSMHHKSQKQQQQQQQRMTTMSGMDLLIQREQEKAEAKRLKPKMNPGKVKIEGLLGKLPEPGTHNINFQQIQQQQQQQHQQFFMNTPVSTPTTGKKYNNRQQIHNYQQPQQFGYSMPPSMYDYYNNGRSSVPPINHHVVYPQQPQSFYQLPTHYMSNGSLYMMNQLPPQQQISRPGSAISNTTKPQRSTTPISFSQQ